MEGEKWYIFHCLAQKCTLPGGSSGLKTNFIPTSGFKTVTERAQSTSCRAAGRSVGVTGSVSRPGRSPGRRSEGPEGAPPGSPEAVSLWQEGEGTPGGRGPGAGAGGRESRRAGREGVPGQILEGRKAHPVSPAGRPVGTP